MSLTLLPRRLGASVLSCGALLALLTCAGIACGAPTRARDAEIAPSQATAELQAACARFVEQRGVVGMGVAVMEHGRIVFAESFGLADRERNAPVTRDTLFRLGSISKPVTATIAMQLAHEGMLDLDRDLCDYAPHLRTRLPSMTLAHVLAHTSGIRHYRDDRTDNSTAHRDTHAALELFLGDPLLSAPGAKYSYSTHAYSVATDVLEHVTGTSFVELVRARMRDRGLRSLDCELLAESKPQRTALYDLVNGKAVLQTPREDNSWKFAGGGMESNALDLARFGEAVRTSTLVPAAARDRMWTATKLADGSTSNYGLGWRLAPERGEILHTGSQQGCHSVLVIVPEKALVLAVMTNTLGAKPIELVPALRTAAERAITD